MISTLVSMCNDRMLPHLRRFVAIRDAVAPGLSLTLVPFDEDMAGVRGFIAGKDGISVMEPDPDFDRIGQRIYGEEEYRPGIKSWRYFRKLNAFAVEAEHFVFADLNAILLADPRAFLNPDPDDDAIIFGTRSILTRTLPLPEVRHTVDILLQGGGQGFNTALFAARPGFLSKAVATEIGKEHLRGIFGKAPEQGFLSFYSAVCGKRACTLWELPEGLSDIRNPSKVAVSVRDRHLYVDEGPMRGRRLVVGKHVGQDIVGLPQAITDFLRAANPAVDWDGI